MGGRGGVWEEGVVCGRKGWCVGGRGGVWEEGVVCGRKGWCVGGRGGVWRKGWGVDADHASVI